MQTPDHQSSGAAGGGEPSVGGISPNWYCSGGWKEEELQRDVKRFQDRIALLETQLSEKDKELETMSEALREERRLEADSLTNMKLGSEKMLEQKGQQVQQLHAAIRKLNESLRKKDQQLSVIVSHNLRADGAYTETAADLSEARVQLRHMEAELNKERMAAQKLDVQVNCLNVNNKKLDDLVQQYRVELARKDTALSSARMQEEHHERHRHTQALEAAETIGDVLAHVSRLDNDLQEQEESLMHAVGVHARCYPSVVRPGQHVKVAITTTSSATPVVSSSVNVSNISKVVPLPQPPQGAPPITGAHYFEASFTAGYREGTGTLYVSLPADAAAASTLTNAGPLAHASCSSLSTAVVTHRASTASVLSRADVDPPSPHTAQAVVYVEGGACGVDLAGTSIHTPTARAHIGHTLTLYITPRNTVGDGVDVVLTSQALRERHAHAPSGASGALATPGSESISPSRLSRASSYSHSIGNTSPVRAPVVSPTLQVTGASISAHVRPVTDGTHRLVIQPLTRRVCVELVDECGVIISRHFTCETPAPDVGRTRLEFPSAVAVGDRGVGRVRLFDSRGFPCPAPTSDPSAYIRASVAQHDPTEVAPAVADAAYGVYLVHFVPLAVGMTALTLRLQDTAFEQQVCVEVTEPGGGAVVDNFTITSEPLAACVEAGHDITYYVAYFDAEDRPANAAPDPSELQVEVEDDNFSVGEIRQDPNAPGGLVFTLFAEQPGATTVTISAARGGRVFDRRIVAVGDGVVGDYHDFHVCMEPSLTAPGVNGDLIVTPVDAVGNALPAIPKHVAEGLAAVVRGSDVTHPLVPHRGGYLTASLASALAPGTYDVTVNTHTTTIDVSSSITVAARAVHKRVQDLVNRLPGILFSLGLREQAVGLHRAEAEEAQKDAERLRARIEDQKRMHVEETRGLYETFAMERENADAKIADLKTKLQAERREQEELQQRWDAREASIERERAQRAEDRKLWMEERDRLTALDEENASLISTLRQQLADAQTKHRQHMQTAMKKQSQQLEDLRKANTDDKLKWDLERATLEARCVHEADRAEEFKREVEAERMKVEQRSTRIDELDQTIRAMKATIQDIQVQKQQLDAHIKKLDEDHGAELQVQQCRLDEQERGHLQALSSTRQSHAAEIAVLTDEIESLTVAHRQEIENSTCEWEAKLAASTAQAAAERVKLTQERDELLTRCDALDSQLRGCQRDTHAERDKAENAARLWETEKRSLERVIDETKQLVREAEQRSIADIETTRSLLDHDRQLWAKEKGALQDRIAQLNEDLDDSASRSQATLQAERRTLEKERLAWTQERQEFSHAAAKLTQKSEDTARQLNRLLEEEKQRHEEEQQVWLTEKADLKAKVKEGAMSHEEAMRKATRSADEIRERYDEEREASAAKYTAFEAEIAELRAAVAEATAKHRTETQTLKMHIETQRTTHLTAVETWERKAAAAAEELDADRRRARHEHQIALEEFEVEKGKHKMRCQTLTQEVENLQQELEETHARHKLKMEETEQERLKWTSERASLREKLAVIEGSAAELADDHKAQLAEYDKLLANTRLEAEATLRTEVAQVEARYMQRLQQQTTEAEAKQASTLEDLQAALERQADTQKAEMARLQASIKEREAIAETWVENARENFKGEIAALEAELAKCKTEKTAQRQRAEAERAEERQKARQEHQQLLDASDAARRRWEEEREALQRELEETRAAHQREINNVNRDLQRAGLEEAEAQQEASRKELVSLRAAWQKQLAAASDAHEKDRRAFAKEREEWRQERAKLWSERNSSKQALEQSLAESNQARDEAELLASQRIDEVTRLVDKVAELETTVEDLTKRLVTKTTADQHLHETQRGDWRVERRDLQAQVDVLRREVEEARGRSRQLEGELEMNQKRIDDDMPERLARAQRCIEELQEELEAVRLTNVKLQREVKKVTAGGDEQQRRHHDAVDRLTQDHKHQYSESQEALRRLQLEKDQCTAAVELNQQKINELGATIERLTEKAATDKAQATREYDELRERYDDLQGRYTEQVQKTAKEAEDLRSLALDSHKTWMEKESAWTQALAEARQAAEDTTAEERGRLEAALEAAEARCVETERELVALRAHVEETEGILETEKRNHAFAHERAQEKWDFDTESWGRERQHLEQQIGTYKKMLGDTQEKQQESIDAMAAERDAWITERLRLREDATALRRQVSELENTVVELEDKHRTEIAALSSSPRRESRTDATAQLQQERLARMTAAHEQKAAEWEEMRTQLAAQQADERQAHATRLREAEADYRSDIASAKERHAAEVQRMEAHLADLQSTVHEQRRRHEHEAREDRERMADEAERTITRFEEERRGWDDERASLLAQIEQHKRNLDNAVAKGEEQVRDAQAALEKDRQYHRSDMKSGREEVEKMLATHTRQAQQEREAFKQERARWEEERRGLQKERDDLTSELEAAMLQTRSARSDAILAHSRSTSPSHANNQEQTDVEKAQLTQELQRTKKQLQTAERELQTRVEELGVTKTRWQQEKAEFDAFLLELDQEKEKERTFQKEITKQHELRIQGDHAGVRNWEAAETASSHPASPPHAPAPPRGTNGSESPMSKATSQPLSYGAYRSVSPLPYSLDEVRDALTAQHGSIAAALSSMMRGQVFDEGCVAEGLALVGMAHCAAALCASAMEEARGGSLFDGLESLLMRSSQHEAAMREYEHNEALDRQLAEQSRRILDRRTSRASTTSVQSRGGASPADLPRNSSRAADIVVSAAEQVVPAAQVMKVQTLTTTIKSSKMKGSFPYFGVDLTDGVRVRGGKHEYLGARVVRSREAALQAGIEVGDTIKGVSGQRVRSLEEFKRAAEGLPTTGPISVVVDRDGVDYELTICPQSTSARPGSLSRYTKNVRVPSLVASDVPEPAGNVLTRSRSMGGTSDTASSQGSRRVPRANVTANYR